MSSGRTIIVADDDDDIRDSLADVLADEGYETRTAANGREALLAIDALHGAPCILILDLMMPLMDGFAVLETLARTHRLAEIPVIVCSAAIPRTALPTGIRHFVHKPISLDVLLSSVEEVVGQPSSLSSAGPSRHRGHLSEPVAGR